jgi:hypothetical protein
MFRQLSVTPILGVFQQQYLGVTRRQVLDRSPNKLSLFLGQQPVERIGLSAVRFPGHLVGVALQELFASSQPPSMLQRADHGNPIKPGGDFCRIAQSVSAGQCRGINLLQDFFDG